MSIYKLNTLYDISLIIFNDSSGTSINMNSNNINNINKITTNNDISHFKYNNRNIIDFNGNTISLNSNTISASVFDVSTIDYTNIDVNNIIVNNYISSDILKTDSLDVVGTMKIDDISFSNLNIQTYDSSNISLDKLYSDKLTINNKLDVSNNFILYNSLIKLDNYTNNDISFSIVNIDHRDILGYNYTQNDNLFINDISNILVYGKIKISTLNAAISQTLSPFNVYLNNIMAGSYTISSDDRLKHNEKDVSNALLTINKINPKIYIKTIDISSNVSDGSISSGYIAQDISNIIELSHSVNNDKYLSINYNFIQPYITQSIKELDNLLSSNDISINNIINMVSLLESRT